MDSAAGIASALFTLSVSLILREEYEQAKRYLSTSLKLFEDLGQKQELLALERSASECVALLGSVLAHASDNFIQLALRPEDEDKITEVRKYISAPQLTMALAEQTQMSRQDVIIYTFDKLHSEYQ